MSDDKQKEVLSGYEQLKRRNRRRLVTTSALVFVSGILLAVAVNTGGGDKAAETKADTAQNSSENRQVDAARAAVLEPDARGSASEAAEEPAPAQASDQQPVEVLRPQTAQAPEDLGPPLVIINDKLADSEIKGLEESEKIQKAEAAKREAEERKEQARIQRQAEQRTAKRAEEKKQSAERDAAEKKRAAVRAEKAEREAAAKRRQDEENQAAAERRAKQAAVEKKEAAEKKEAVKAKAADYKKKDTAEEGGKKAADTVAAKSARPSEKPEKAKAAEKPASKERAAIQAGYAEKERAQSLQRKMKAAGINASISEIKTDKGVVYRVKSNAYGSRQDAARDLEKLRVHGIAGQVVNE